MYLLSYNLPPAASLLILLLGGIVGCNSAPNSASTATESVSQGNIRIAVDEAFQPVIAAQISAYQHQYPKAQINPLYVSETEAISLLLKDSVRLAIVTRRLSPEEAQLIEKQKVKPKSTLVAFDAIAVIVHPSRTDTLLQMNTLKDIISGKYTRWSEVFPPEKSVANKSKTAANDSIRVVVDHPQSGIARYLQDSVLGGQKLAAHVYAVRSNAQVVDYVHQNPNALGLIALNWVSDPEDTTALKFLSKIKVMALAPAGEKEYFLPFIYNMIYRKYPMIRPVYVLSREHFVGLGTGFTVQVARDNGQRIFMKQDLMPANMPFRIVEMKEGNLH